MSKGFWIGIALAVSLVIASTAAWFARIDYLPSILMFVAAIAVIGVMMKAEDVLIGKYDTPHDEDKHPPKLIALRAVRGLVLLIMGVMIFVMMR